MAPQVKSKAKAYPSPYVVTSSIPDFYDNLILWVHERPAIWDQETSDLTERALAFPAAWKELYENCVWHYNATRYGHYQVLK